MPGATYIPALDVFSNMLLGDIKSSRRVIDPTRFGADKECLLLYRELSYVTIRLPWAAMEYFAAHDLLATVRAEHQAFYKRLLGRHAVCAHRAYPNLQKRISLMTLDYGASATMSMRAIRSSARPILSGVCCSNVRPTRPCNAARRNAA
jgi:hypothetical protein